MRKHGCTPSRRGKRVTLAAISPPAVARGCFVGGHQSGLAGCKPPPLFMRGASSCQSQGQRQGEPWGASPRPSAPTYLPTSTLGSVNVERTEPELATLFTVRGRLCGRPTTLLTPVWIWSSTVERGVTSGRCRQLRGSNFPSTNSHTQDTS